MTISIVKEDRGLRYSAYIQEFYKKFYPEANQVSNLHFYTTTLSIA